jgi:hypothetical protein
MIPVFIEFDRVFWLLVVGLVLVLGVCGMCLFGAVTSDVRKFMRHRLRDIVCVCHYFWDRYSHVIAQFPQEISRNEVKNTLACAILPRENA